MASTKIAKLRLSIRVEDFVEYLQTLFPELKFSFKVEKRSGDYSKANENVIYCDSEIDENREKEIIKKLELTSIPFVDKKNNCYNW